MDGMKEKISQAKSAGYKDEEILQFLAQMPDVGPKIATAVENQYKPNEILSFLSESEAYKVGKQMSKKDRAIISALSGPTLGFIDELAGAVSAPMLAMRRDIPLSQAYTMGRDIFRGAVAAGRQVLPAIEAVSPAIARTAQRVGQYFTGAPAGQALGLGQRTAQAGVSGLSTGAISGVGASTGESVGDVLSDAAKSAMLGGVLGTATQPAMAVLGAGGRQAMARMSPTAAGTYAQQKVAEALIRDRPEALAPSALSMAQARLLKLGPEARIADVGGKSTRNLLDVQATLPGTTTEAVERAIRERQAGRAGRLMTSADETLGTQGAQFMQSLENFSKQRKIESRPYYAVVDNAVIKADSNLIDLLNRSKDLLAYSQTQHLKRTGQEIDLLNIQTGQSIPMSVLDTLKQSLYDQSQSLKKLGKTGAATNDDEIRKNLINALIEKSPKVGGKSAYAQALEKWAGPSQMIDAAEIGRKAMTGDIINFRQELKGLTQSEIDAFRVGALQALREKTGTEAGQTSLLKMWKEPATQDRLKAVFDGDYRTFASAVAKEARLKPLEGVGRGSQTAARLAGTADLDIAPLGQAAAAVASGSPTGILAAATNLARQTRTPEAVRNEIGRILLSRDPQQLEQLSAVIQRLNAERLRAAGMGGQTAGQIGSMVPLNNQ